MHKKSLRKEEIAEDFSELTKALKAIDYSEKMDEDKLYQRFKIALEKEKEIENMKKHNIYRKVMATAGMVAVVTGVMTQTAFGQGVVNNVIKIFHVGHSQVIQETKDKEGYAELPEEVKGKVFDAQGNPLDYAPYTLEGVYDKDGKQVLGFHEGKVITEQSEIEAIKAQVEEQEKEENEKLFKEEDPSKINDYTAFTAKLPTYLPNGVNFKEAEFYNEGGVPKDSLYVGFNFTNEKGENVIYMQERKACEETAGVGGTDDTVIEVEINGVTGVMYDHCIEWEAEDTTYFMSSQDGKVSRDEMLKMARSIK